MFVIIFFKTVYNKTITRFGFCDILNNQGLGYRCYQPRPSARLITVTSTLIKSGYHKNLLRQILVTQRQFFLRRFKKLRLCAASLVERTRVWVSNTQRLTYAHQIMVKYPLPRGKCFSKVARKTCHDDLCRSSKFVSHNIKASLRRIFD